MLWDHNTEEDFIIPWFLYLFKKEEVSFEEQSLYSICSTCE